MIRDNEAVYDEKISPLMVQVIAVCKGHGIPLFATFQYAPPDDAAGRGAGMCTTRIPADGEDGVFDALHYTLANHHRLLAFAVTTAPGGG